MDNKKLDDLIIQIENYLECWKQFNHYLSLARTKKFGQEDENQFLEIKSVLAQELEMIISGIEFTNPTKDEVHEMMNSIPSLRHISQLNEGALGNIEHQWHLIYIRWHATLGQLKVKYKELELRNPKPGFLHRWTTW